MTAVRRYGLIAKIKPGCEQEYIDYHNEKMWPEIKKAISERGIKNYSIYLSDGYLFAYYESDPNCFDKKLDQYLSDPIGAEWEKKMAQFIDPLHVTENGNLWKEMQEIFHME